MDMRDGFRADHVFRHSVRGFAARLTATQIAVMWVDTNVAYVEPDGVMTVVQTIPWGITKVGANVSSTKAGDGKDSIGNVNAYVIDTGVDTKHGDLNVVRRVNFAGGQNADCHGHGTHVAVT